MSTLAEQLVSLVAPASMEADQYRGLRHTIERMHAETGLQMLAITSPGPGDGKSVTTLNLAGSLAQSPDTRVLVVDADLHRPSVGKYLGIDEPEAPGLVDLILDEDLRPAAIIRRLDALNLSVLLPGVCRSGAYELLNSPRLAARLKEARSSFDYVLIDTPPLLPLPDCRLIGQWVDGFIILVTAHRTPRKALADALAMLDSNKVLGTVFNGDDRPLAPYGGYYGYYGRHEVVPRYGRTSR
jgi:receptor protein-tyrosine kinase